MKVLIADALSDKAVDVLKSARLAVDIKTGLTGEELQAIIGDYDALIVRSSTRATREVIEKGTNLKVIGRAGIGVDNVDVSAATEKGIVVMNTPQGNALAAAEHSIALMFAAARKIAYADRTMKEGKWEKKSLMGVELYQKTLGIVGIGNIGSIVAQKALALGMRVIAHDLYVSQEFAQTMGVELVDFETLLRESDFIAIHVPLAKETRGMINKDAIGKMKRGVTVINVARGPVVVEKDLLEGLESGHIGCAALDVFDEEPPARDNPLILSQKTICTPHLGASTKEAQDKVAIDIANQIVDYFKDGVIKNSVNTPSVSFEVIKQVSPYLRLAEKLGTVVSRITDFPLKEITIQYLGEIASAETRILTQGIVKNILQEQMEGVNYVNALVVAKSRAIKIKETKAADGGDFASLLVVAVAGEKGENSVQGTLFGKKEPRLIKVNNIYLEADLKGHMLFVYNYDRPGVIASIANVFFIRGINIGGMHFGRENVGGLAISLLDLDREIEDNVIREIQSLPNIVAIKKIELP